VQLGKPVTGSAEKIQAVKQGDTVISVYALYRLN